MMESKNIIDIDEKLRILAGIGHRGDDAGRGGNDGGRGGDDAEAPAAAAAAAKIEKKQEFWLLYFGTERWFGFVSFLCR